MNLVDQTQLHDPENGVVGNCFSAVLASLLQLPIESVPMFVNPETWQRDVNKWLRQYNLAFMQVAEFDGWCKDLDIVGCYHELSGRTDRFNDVMHATVAIDGKFVFDPHPSKSGLTTVEGYGIFIALHPWKVVPRSTASDEELTRIYNEANGIQEGKSPPISTARIFAAMRACLQA